MNKSIYSLVLSDDIIAAIDRMAYEQNTSRSNMVDRILAEHISYVTPEMRIREISSYITKQMEDTFQMLSSARGSMLTFKSPLSFKYKPNIKYQLTLTPDRPELCGVLTVSFRTQNAALLSHLERFFMIWSRAENGRLSRYLPGGTGAEYSDGHITRPLFAPLNLPFYSGDDIGAAITDYINMLDTAIKHYFANWQQQDILLFQQLDRLICSWMSDKNTIII